MIGTVSLEGWTVIFGTVMTGRGRQGKTYDRKPSRDGQRYVACDLEL